MARFVARRTLLAATALLAAGLAGCGETDADPDGGEPGAGLGGREAGRGQSGPQLDPSADTGEPGGYDVRELCFERDGLRIYGELYEPVGAAGEAAGTPLAVISHGFCSSYRATARDAERLAKAGTRCYVYDFCGGSPDSASEGDFLDMSVLTEVDDLEAVIDGLLDQGLVGNRRLFLMGESQGGLVSALVAARRPDSVAGLVLIYPAFSIPDDARERFSSVGEIPETVEGLFGVTVGRRYYADILDLDPFAEIGAYEGPVLIAHGDADAVVPVAYSERAAEVYDDAELCVIEGAGHGFTDDELDDVCAWAEGLIAGEPEH